jgi:hypothetical protein
MGSEDKCGLYQKQLFSDPILSVFEFTFLDFCFVTIDQHAETICLGEGAIVLVPNRTDLDLHRRTIAQGLQIPLGHHNGHGVGISGYPDAGLAGQRFEIEHWNGTTTYSIRDPHYVELYVEHSYSDGADRVTIAWQGNF